MTDEAPKALGSTDAMERSAHTSPFYPAWVELCGTRCPAIRDAVAMRDLDRLGPLVEQSATAMHACAWASLPPILYARPATLAALDTVRTLRASHGVSVWATMDAGPQVKALCRSSDAEQVERALKQTPGVRATLVTRPGKGVELLE